MGHRIGVAGHLKQLHSGSPADMQLITPWGQAAIHINGHNEGAALLVDLGMHLHKGARRHKLNGFSELDAICLGLLLAPHQMPLVCVEAIRMGWRFTRSAVDSSLACDGPVRASERALPPCALVQHLI